MRSRHLPILGLILVGAILMILHLVVSVISPRLEGYDPAAPADIWLYVGLTALAGGVFSSLLFLLPRLQDSRRMVLLVLGVGLGLRGLFFGSTPILEDDWYRYLWDGGVVAEGLDPYAYAPAEAFDRSLLPFQADAMDEEPELERFRRLGAQPEAHLERVNYPFVKTIYPPAAQLAFYLAHQLAPYSLDAWRFVLLCADLLGVGLILLALHALGRSLLWSALYWWNPLVTFEGFNAGHMDILLVPCIAAVIVAVVRGRTGAAAVALSVSAAVKLWPVMLAPIVFRMARLPAKSWVAPVLLFGGLTAVLLLPQLLHVLDPKAGLVTYAEGWRKNAFLFSLLTDLMFAFSREPEAAARVIVGLLLIGYVAYLAVRADEQRDVPALVLAAICGLFFLSPTGYPWYAIWIVCLLPFVPSRGLAVLAVTLPLYYTRFIFGDAHPVYQWGAVPMAFAIPLTLLVMELYHARKLPFLARRRDHSLP